VWQNCTGCENGEIRQCGTDKGICEYGNETCVDYVWSDECIGGVSGCFGTWDEEVLFCVETECDRIDEDCDGIVDNINKGTSAEETKCWCYGGRSPRLETVEECNDIDDDCDGEPDEGLICCYLGETRRCGITNVGECRYGTETCTAQESWQGATCVGAIEPIEEICYDGKDNDCDGQIDELPLCDPEITCFNGIQDLNERGVDCGGDCDESCEENPFSFIIFAIIVLSVIFGFAFYQIKIKKEINKE